MMWLPELPEFDGDASGQCYVPEEIDFGFHEGPDEDEFVRLLLEVMSKPVRGGSHG